jgi:hypothetical protein
MRCGGNRPVCRLPTTAISRLSMELQAVLWISLNEGLWNFLFGMPELKLLRKGRTDRDVQLTHERTGKN